MKRLKTALIGSSLSLGLVMGTGLAAFAEPPHCPPGHEKKGWCDNDRRADRWDEREDARERREAYREGYEDGKRDAIHYGDRYYSDYRVIDNYNRYDLSPPPNGYYYAEVDDQVVMVRAATQLITQFFSEN